MIDKTDNFPAWLKGSSFVRGPIIFVAGLTLTALGQLLLSEHNPTAAVGVGWTGWFIQAVGMLDFLISIFSRIFGKGDS